MNMMIGWSTDWLVDWLVDFSSAFMQVWSSTADSTAQFRRRQSVMSSEEHHRLAYRVHRENTRRLCLHQALRDLLHHSRPSVYTHRRRDGHQTVWLWTRYAAGNISGRESAVCLCPQWWQSAGLCWIRWGLLVQGTVYLFYKVLCSSVYWSRVVGVFGVVVSSLDSGTAVSLARGNQLPFPRSALGHESGYVNFSAVSSNGLYL